MCFVWMQRAGCLFICLVCLIIAFLFLCLRVVRAPGIMMLRWLVEPGLTVCNRARALVLLPRWRKAQWRTRNLATVASWVHGRAHGASSSGKGFGGVFLLTLWGKVLNKKGLQNSAALWCVFVALADPQAGETSFCSASQAGVPTATRQEMEGMQGLFAAVLFSACNDPGSLPKRSSLHKRGVSHDEWLGVSY